MSGMDRPRTPRRNAAILAIAAALLAMPFASSGSAAVPSVEPPTRTEPAPPAAPGDLIKLTLITSGLSSPVYVTHAGDGTNRLFIVEKTGRIRILQNGQLLAKPFLDISDRVSRGSEQGLLGLAFHPNFRGNHKVYVNFTDRLGDTIITEYQTYFGNTNLVKPSTRRRILKVDQPYENHNGGGMNFGPDGFLYIGLGDGGSGGDPGNRAQNKETLLGKMLRIGINGSTGSRHYKIPGSNPFVGTSGWDAIWMYGLRNPWRWSFDRSTGDLWIGDVGQNSWEEIDHGVDSGHGPGKGVNWGWRVLEGTHCYPSGNSCNTSGKAMPVIEYAHSGGRCSVTGGYVYRGAAIPSIQGDYLYGDFCSGEIWGLDNPYTSPTPVLLLDTSLLVSSFGEDRNGELYVTDLNGRLYRVDQAT
jgi:glucose/arabinose dehydrogenase